jgi:type II secretory pathway pseudopilin PulG
MASLTRIFSARFQAGFTYVGLLIAIVFFGLGSVGGARVLASSERGEREAELLFVGNQFRQAIASYYSASPGAPRYPEKLEDLLLDPRFPVIKRHLRKMHVDPITSKAEWGLVKAPEGGIMGVHSMSEREPMKRTNFDFADQGFSDAATSAAERTYSYKDWQFLFLPAGRNSVSAGTKR